MPKFLLILSVTLFQPAISIAKDGVVVSLLTVDRGDEVYAVFGHSAIRVRDTVSGKDSVYNFGVFDFDTPNFAFKFTRGNLKYFSTVSPYQEFIYYYSSEKRCVSELLLRLTPDEIDRVLDNLDDALKPGNLYYEYRPFKENCSTKIRDILYSSIRFKVQENLSPASMTYRESVLSCVKNKPWLELGLNILLGSDADKKMGLSGSTYLPANLEIMVEHAAKNKFPLFTSKATISSYACIKMDSSSSFWSSPVAIFTLLIVLTLGLSLSRRKLSSIVLKVLDFLLFFSLGVLGILLCFLAIYSKHEILSSNINILWAMPIHVIYAVCFLGKNRILSVYRITNMLLVIFAIVILVCIQKVISPSLIVLWTLVLIRLISHQLTVCKSL